jgi:hypothetical protein
MPPRRTDLLKLKLDMVYRGLAKDKAETRFTEIVTPVPAPAPAPAPAPLPAKTNSSESKSA